MTAAAIAWILAFLTPAQALTSQTIDAPTSSGVIRGLLDDGVASFKGVPYAAPPIGPFRWKPPMPPQPWTTPRPAFAFGPMAVQTAGANPYGPVVGSED